ncbi:MAG: HutD family protein [Bradyrhizobiaceae bacterium]|nr:MAG: HutD family protein [Bradyrhizobiaceae bacterium]
MQILRATAYRRMPWRNGGGETIEMAVSPAGASFDTFDWRLSMAHVGASGPFSLFPDTDRTLSVIAGNGLTLKLPDRDVTLDRKTAPFAFPGDVTVDSTLVDGPIDDLNVMTRRTRCHHRVQRRHLAVSTTLALSGEIAVLVAIGGGVEVVAGSQAVTLDSKDALALKVGDISTLTATPQGTPQGTVDLFVVEIAFE